MNHTHTDLKNGTIKKKLPRVFKKKKKLQEYIFILILIIMVYLLITIFLS